MCREWDRGESVVSLELQGVSVAFDATVAVDAVDLGVEDGHVLAVLGPSGCGKSTLLRAVAGLEPLSSGRIAWDGADPWEAIGVAPPAPEEAVRALGVIVRMMVMRGLVDVREVADALVPPVRKG